MERKDRVSKLEAATGTGAAGQKTRTVRIRGAHDKLWEYTIGAVDGMAQVISERIVSDEEQAQNRQSPEQEARGRARSSLRYYAEWAGKFPDEYPGLRDQLEYAREHVSPGEGEDQIYDAVYDELLAGVA